MTHDDRTTDGSRPVPVTDRRAGEPSTLHPTRGRPRPSYGIDDVWRFFMRACVVALVVVASACGNDSGDAATGDTIPEATSAEDTPQAGATAAPAPTTAPSPAASNGDAADTDGSAQDASSSEQSTSVVWEDQLRGVWLNDIWPDMVVQFGPGDEISIDSNGAVGEGAAVRGSFTVVDDVLTFTTDDRAWACGAGEVYGWSLSMPADGMLTIEIVESRGSNCAVVVGSVWTFRRLSPVSVGGAALTGPPQTPEDTPATSADLKGVWIREGSGELLLLGADGSFVRTIDGDLVDAPLDRGRFEVLADDAGASLRFMSDGTGTCPTGDLEFVDVHLLPGDPGSRLTGAMEVDTTTDPCGDAAGPQRYARIVGE